MQALLIRAEPVQANPAAARAVLEALAQAALRAPGLRSLCWLAAERAGAVALVVRFASHDDCVRFAQGAQLTALSSDARLASFSITRHISAPGEPSQRQTRAASA